MRYLLLLLCLPLMGQTPDYGRTAQAGALYDFTAAAHTLPVKAGLTLETPSSCTASKELYVKTDAAAGQQLFICNAAGNGFVLVGDGGASSLPAQTGNSGRFLTTDGTSASWGAVSGGGGGGTINSGAGKGIWLPWSSSAYSSSISPPWTYLGYRYPVMVPAQMEFRAINAYIAVASGTACPGGTCGLQFGIYTYDMTSRVAYTTTATSGGTPNINAVGAARFVFGGGSAVTAGVLTLPAGVYWLVWSSDFYNIALSTFQDSTQQVVINATTTTGTYTTRVGRSTSALGSGNGASFALLSDLSAATWETNPGSEMIVVALVN